uniref:Uncharacterized protein n=1 Tax=Peronospora matthiolae TaxID=2874970 RepID=A0AAV1TLU5_9STRA
MQQNVLDMPLSNIRYVMTDFTKQNLKFWKTHPAFVPFVKSGILKFAILTRPPTRSCVYFCLGLSFVLASYTIQSV